MKKYLHILFFFLLILCVSCVKEDFHEEDYTIIGIWGMKSGTITGNDGVTKRYNDLGDGIYYQYLTFYPDGSVVKTSEPDRNNQFGVYVYNDALKALSYKWDSKKYYYDASINVIAWDEMTMTTDYGAPAMITQYFKKINKIPSKN